MANSATTSPRRVAVIDLGSNSILLLVLEEGGRVIRDESRITRLGERVFQTGRIDPQASARSRRVAAALAAMAREEGVDHVLGVGTEALRRAEDGQRFLDALCRDGILDEARLLSGEAEASLAIEASRRSLAGAGLPLSVLDVGGGSTEVAWLDAAGRVHSVSLPVGSVRLTESCVRSHPIPRRQLARLRSEARHAAASLPRTRAEEPRGEETVVAVSGTATTLAALELRLTPYDPERIEGVCLSRARLAHWVERLAALGLEERRELPGLEPGRADVIVAGLVILHALLARMDAPEFRVSGRGVRHGAALRLLEGRRPV